jgi:hypothetical protein
MAPKQPDSPTMMQAQTSLIGEVGGVRIYIRAGEVIDADHPAVKKWPKAFGPVYVTHRTPRRSAITPPEVRAD